MERGRRDGIGLCAAGHGKMYGLQCGGVSGWKEFQRRIGLSSVGDSVEELMVPWHCASPVSQHATPI